MIAILCVDDALGTMFNGRRQSRDSVMVDKLMAYIGQGRLWMRPYSATLFAEYAVMVDASYLERATVGEYCFVEGDALTPHLQSIEKVILFRWNRAYPADQKLDIDMLAGWDLESSETFCGSSHPKLQMDVYRKAEAK